MACTVLNKLAQQKRASSRSLGFPAIEFPDFGRRVGRCPSTTRSSPVRTALAALGKGVLALGGGGGWLP